MTVRLKQADYDAIVAHAKAGLPNESCGLIAGTAEGGLKTVEKVYLLSNPDQSPEHFPLTPGNSLRLSGICARWAFRRSETFTLILPLPRGRPGKISGWPMIQRPAT